jgi:GNAT superfamily N-acetyltransferase
MSSLESFLETCLRPANADDIASMEDLIRLSAAFLSQGYYSEPEIIAAIETVFGVDTQLVQDQTYYVIEQKRKMLACGGWSYRKTLFGGDRYHGREIGKLNPAKDAAKIRAFFVHPEAARKGVGRMLLEKCEAEAQKAGFSRAEMMATLPGVPFYARMGYIACGEYVHQAEGYVPVRFVKMEKALGTEPGKLAVVQSA